MKIAMTIAEPDDDIKAALDLGVFVVSMHHSFAKCGYKPSYEHLPCEIESQEYVSAEAKTILKNGLLSSIGFGEYLVFPNGRSDYFLYVGRGYNSKPTDPIVVWMYVDGKYRELKASRRCWDNGRPKQTDVNEAVDEYISLVNYYERASNKAA